MPSILGVGVGVGVGLGSNSSPHPSPSPNPDPTPNQVRKDAVVCKNKKTKEEFIVPSSLTL